MITITKERLLTIKQWRETYGPGSNVVLPAEEAEELARIALASLEAVSDERAAYELFMEKRFGESVDRRRAKNGDSEYMAWDMALGWIIWCHRATMLQSQDSGIKNGWISCSERMPDTKTAVLVAREFDRKGDWRMKWATYIPGHPDANDGWIIPGASWKPSHWMPLPEPPQEAK
ncbi:DUF551 domain-containing protein [Escherichia coli]|nr:DUF551 domain-containing protein [Escherichia coli]